MGGKDSIVVDADADLDAAVEGVALRPSASAGRSARPARAPSLTSASTTSSCKRLKERVEKITVGDPTQNPNMGPVVNEKSMKSILGYIEKGIAEGGRLITGGARATEAGDGYFVQPTVIADVDPMGTILRSRRSSARCWR